MDDLDNQVDPTTTGDEPKTEQGSPLAIVVRVLAEALQGRRASVAMPPWACWLVVSLIRYRERQRWALGCLHRRVVDWDRREPEPIPDQPGWQLHMSRGHVAVTCRATGEEIGLSVDRGRRNGPGELGADAIGPVAFAAWISSLVTGGGSSALEVELRELFRHRPDLFVPRALPPERLPEARVWRWIPSEVLIAHLLYLLHDIGLLSRDGRDSDYELPSQIDALAPLVAVEDFASPEVATRWASRLCDAELATAQSGLTSKQLVAAHKRWVQGMLRDSSKSDWLKDGMLPLLVMHFDGAELVWACDVLLESEQLAGHYVLEFLLQRSDLPPSNAVGRLLEQLPVDRDHLATAARAIEYLTSRKHQRELAAKKFVAFAALAETDDSAFAVDLRTYAQLALDSFPAHVLRLVRRALRWHYNEVVADVAAALVALDLPWCTRELVAAYHAPSPHTDCLREALGLVHHRPAEFLPVIGKSRIANQAAWFRDHWPRWYPPHFGEEGG
jgi:hypothetical protein